MHPPPFCPSLGNYHGKPSPSPNKNNFQASETCVDVSAKKGLFLLFTWVLGYFQNPQLDCSYLEIRLGDIEMVWLYDNFMIRLNLNFVNILMSRPDPRVGLLVA